MRKIVLGSVLSILTLIATAQNVGIGTSSPNTKLDVSGAIRHQETNNITINSSGTNNVPANVSELQLIAGTVSAAFTLTATNTYYMGQDLIIYNNTIYACTFGSYTIPAQQAMHFIYSSTPGSSGSTSVLSWVAASPASSGGTTYWGTSGNTGTTAGTNYLGTTDGTNLSFKTNATQRMLLLGLAFSSQYASTVRSVTLGLYYNQIIAPCSKVLVFSNSHKSLQQMKIAASI